MVNNNYSAANSYQFSQVNYADPVELVVMLYDGAIQRVQEASQKMSKGNHLGSGVALYRALAILAELRKSLNMEEGGEIATNLDRLYLHMHEELVRGNLERKPDRLDSVKALLSELRGGWEQVAKQAKKQAVAGTTSVQAAGAAYLGASESAGIAIKA